MRITKLDGLRGIFSLMVVLYHYPAEYIPSFITTNFMVAKSYLFVDFFFVLSGFVITYNYHNKINTSDELISFMKKRFIRLYPLLLYTTFIFLFVILGVKLFLPHLANNKDSFLPAIVDTLSTLTFMNSTPLNSTTFGINGNHFGMNYPSWSISAEMFAYLFFALIALWAVREKKNQILGSSIFIGMAFLLSIAYFDIQTNFHFIRGIIGFNIGYFIYLRSRSSLRLNRTWEISVLIIFFGNFFISSLMINKIWIDLMDIVIMPLTFGFIILILTKTDGIVSKIMDSKPFQFLGKISYSLYLNHAIVIFVLPKAMFAILNFQQSVGMQIGVMIVIIGILIVYSYITYDFIEVKAGDFLKRIWLKRTPIAIKVV